MPRIGALLVAALVALATAAGPVAADSLNDGDRAQIQGIISGQIAAFQRDDDAGAHALASPGIHDAFPTVGDFIAMVKNGYQPVYRAQSVTFGKIVETPAGPLQEVYVTGPDGLDYVAVYQLRRQPNGSWKISGCTLVRDERPMT